MFFSNHFNKYFFSTQLDTSLDSPFSRLPFQTEEISTDSSLEKADENLHSNHTLNSLNDKDLTVSEEHSTGRTGLVHSTHRGHDISAQPGSAQLTPTITGPEKVQSFSLHDRQRTGTATVLPASLCQQKSTSLGIRRYLRQKRDQKDYWYLILPI